MTLIRATCPVCGELELRRDDVHLVTFDQPRRDYYEFICPSCGDLIRKAADPYVVHALRVGRVPETRIALPAEALDPKREWTAPLTYNELLDFVLELGLTDELAGAR